MQPIRTGNHDRTVRLIFKVKRMYMSKFRLPEGPPSQHRGELDLSCGLTACLLPTHASPCWERIAADGT